MTWKSCRKRDHLTRHTLIGTRVGHPSKLTCLDAARAFAQDRYQFGVHRRTMLLQAPDPRSGGAHIAKQISDIVANCDASTEALVRTVDPAAQLDRLLDQHWGSALAIVLRKVSYFHPTGFWP